MPEGVYIPSKSKSKKKKGGHSFFGSITHPFKVAAKDVGHVATGTGKGLYRGVTGLPTGAYMTGRAIGHDVIHDPLRTLSPGYNLYQLIHGKGHTGKLAHAMGRAEYEQYRHFGRGGDLSGPLLDALAILSAGGGSVARVGAAS